ncbi:MAG: hypothetical protein KAU07_04320 [Candidatus Andersenbacteria bacterium]|nr:hypothetical protein [Candidatus Andersenbacteria bacterium]
MENNVIKLAFISSKKEPEQKSFSKKIFELFENLIIVCVIVLILILAFGKFPNETFILMQKIFFILLCAVAALAFAIGGGIAIGGTK